MKTGEKRMSAVSAKTYKTAKFKFETTFKEFKAVTAVMNKLRAAEVVDNEIGATLPNNLGKIIILKRKPKITKLYSMTRPGTRIYNNHSFQFIAKVCHKERLLMRYPELYKFRPHRANIKMPLYDRMISGQESYFKVSDYYGS